MRSVYCGVPGCANQLGTPGVSYVTIPRAPEKCEKWLSVLDDMDDIVDDMLNENPHMPRVLQTIKETLSQKVELNWLNEMSESESECLSTGTHSQHISFVKDKVLVTICHICIPWWCKTTNRELKYK